MKWTLLYIPLLLTGCLGTEVWKGFYYKDRHDLGDESKTIRSQTTFKSLDECRIWVNAIKQSRPEDEYDYECGLNCKSNSTNGLEVCEKTER